MPPEGHERALSWNFYRQLSRSVQTKTRPRWWRARSNHTIARLWAGV